MMGEGSVIFSLHDFFRSLLVQDFSRCMPCLLTFLSFAFFFARSLFPAPSLIVMKYFWKWLFCTPVLLLECRCFKWHLGWTMVFKTVSGLTEDPFDAYNSAHVIAERELSALDVTNWGNKTYTHLSLLPGFFLMFQTCIPLAPLASSDLFQGKQMWILSIYRYLNRLAN